MDSGIGRIEHALLAFLWLLAGIAALALAWQAAIWQPIQVGPAMFDRLSALMTLLVGSIGAVTYRFALRALDGEPGQRRFLRWLAVTVGAAYLLMLATNLLLLFAMWALTSLGLHQLLTFYPDRREAQRPARKKFLISRLGDLLLLGAIGVIWLGWGTLDLPVLLASMPAGEQATTTVAILIVAAALTKSAQFPFHSWLPETMEAPTPVSALMHAGIINAGGVLLLRFAPLLTAVPAVLFLLALIGTLTAALGALAMWAQTDIKRTLAWSTVSQMGFMMVQCGLAAFPAAALHILGHGCYKAWSFLRTGQLPPAAPAAMPLSPRRTLLLGMVGTLVAIPMLAAAARLTGFDPTHAPGTLALAVIAALALGQLWVAVFRAPLTASGVRSQGSGVRARRVLLAVIVTGAMSVLTCAVYRGAELFLAPVFGPLAAPTGLLGWATAALPVATFAGLIAVHALLPTLSATPTGRALRIHALHGFYFGIYTNRFVDSVWRVAPPSQPVFELSGQAAVVPGSSDA